MLSFDLFCYFQYKSIFSELLFLVILLSLLLNTVKIVFYLSYLDKTFDSDWESWNTFFVRLLSLQRDEFKLTLKTSLIWVCSWWFQKLHFIISFINNIKRTFSKIVSISLFVFNTWIINEYFQLSFVYYFSFI